MSTPIYDALCEAMPGPDGHDGEETVPSAQGDEVDGAAERDGKPSGAADRDGKPSGAAGRADAAGPAASNGEVGAAHDGATSHNGKVVSNTATSRAGR